jgi:hypothetical protein
MAEKLIRLPQLQRFKTNADAKYQDKLTAGSNITISGNTISATGTPGYVGAKTSGSNSISSGTLTNVGTVTLQPGLYIIQYTCQFASNSTGNRQCGFSTNTTDISGFGRSFCDIRAAVTNATTQTEVVGIVSISASDYPNGRTFYLLAQQNSGSALTAYPRCYYTKL